MHIFYNYYEEFMKEKDNFWGGSLSLGGLSEGGVAGGDASKDDDVPLASNSILEQLNRPLLVIICHSNESHYTHLWYLPTHKKWTASFVFKLNGDTHNICFFVQATLASYLLSDSDILHKRINFLTKI